MGVTNHCILNLLLIETFTVSEFNYRKPLFFLFNLIISSLYVGNFSCSTLSLQLCIYWVCCGGRGKGLDESQNMHFEMQSTCDYPAEGSLFGSRWE